MSSDTKIAVGLTEFVSKLIEETFNAVALSAQEQAERDGKFLETVNLSLEEFIAKHITGVEIDNKLEEHFPADKKGVPHAIYAGAPYVPAKGEEPEQPPIKESLNCTLSDGGYSGGKLTEAGVAAIREAARVLTGKQLYESFKKMVSRGIPRVVVEKGRILTKLTFETHELENNDTETGAAPSGSVTSQPLAAAMTPRFMIKKSPSNVLTMSTENLKRLSKIRLAVAPVSRDEQAGGSSGSVYGEVEIQFKTVAD
jgi:hypothetical protein